MPAFVDESAAQAPQGPALVPPAVADQNAVDSNAAKKNDEMQTPAGQGFMNSITEVNQQFVLLIILLLFYCVPLVVFAVVAFIQMTVYSEDYTLSTGFSKVIHLIAADPGRYTGAISQLIVPAAAAITAANYNNIEIRKWGSSLFVVPLIGIFACIINTLLFDIALEKDADRLVVGTMFINMGGNLTVYVMMLVGLKAVDAKSEKNR